MIRRIWIASMMAAALAAALMLTPTTAQGATASTGAISLTATVDSFAEWAAANDYSIDATDFGHITSMTATQTATRDLTIYTNVAVTVTSTAGANSGVLTDGSAHTLTTEYNLTANSGANGWLGAATALTDPPTFFARSYPLSIATAAGIYTMRLTVTATPIAGAAPAAGNYTAGLSLTATW